MIPSCEFVACGSKGWPQLVAPTSKSDRCACQGLICGGWFTAKWSGSLFVVITGRLKENRCRFAKRVNWRPSRSDGAWDPLANSAGRTDCEDASGFPECAGFRGAIIPKTTNIPVVPGLRVSASGPEPPNGSNRVHHE